jgi:hypothetical protein
MKFALRIAAFVSSILSGSAPQRSSAEMLLQAGPSPKARRGLRAGTNLNSEAAARTSPTNPVTALEEALAVSAIVQRDAPG